MIVTINPDNGPGAFMNQNYTQIAQKLKSVGIIDEDTYPLIRVEKIVLQL